MKRVSAIIVAAGEGQRFGSPKQFAPLGGKLVLDWCLEAFDAHAEVDEIILVVKDKAKGNEYLQRYGKVAAVVRGGKKRQDSVLSGFQQLDPAQAEVVLVHDGVRPFIRGALISRVIQATRERGAVIPVIPVEDTIKIVEGEEVKQTLEREKLFRAQTPQGFLYSTLKKALDKASEEGFYGTDEASLVERVGESVGVVQGDVRNIKVTTPEDLKMAEVFFES
ncbi:MAG: 2-C-methyl-D-erythritol 4-phosphate cytidylyltransferase [Candidatus Aminicenantes bacterium]|nr:2-C-methyl-D-erythritol 4-phosphate cytidylyltransferase [Candidatus Aminicenantes bacterium]